MSWEHLHACDDIQRDQPLLLAVGKFDFHVFTSGLIVAWIALVASTLVVLERAVNMSKESISIPWMYSTDGLPSLLVTIVAQGHVAVTTMYITRLALSGLQVPFGTPRSWAEVFWLADAKWGGPVGIIETVLAAIPLRIKRVSKAFLLFSVISMAAFALPLILQSAYTVTTVEVTIQERCTPYTVSRSALSMVDAYKQMGSGSAAWATGQSVIALYNRTAYHPVGQPRGNSSGGDFFFAGDIQGHDMTLPGVRVQNNCINRDDIDPSSLFPTPGNDTTFKDFCRKEMKGVEVWSTRVSVPTKRLPVDMVWCTDADLRYWAQTPSVSAFTWYNNSYHIPAIDDYRTRSGLTYCAVNIHFGTAQLNGRDMSYDSFTPDDTIVTDGHGGEGALDPTRAIINSFEFYAGRVPSYVDNAILLGQLGFVEVIDYGPVFAPPTSAKFAEQMQNGVFHMAVSLMVLSRTNDTAYDCTTHHAIPGFIRNTSMATGAISLLIVWLAGLLLATVMLLRPTFSDAMDSHVAARLLLHRPDLVEGVPMGPHEKNKKLAEEFSGVQLNCSEGKFERVEMEKAGVGNYAETHSVETHG